MQKKHKKNEYIRFLLKLLIFLKYIIVQSDDFLSIISSGHDTNTNQKKMSGASNTAAKFIAV